MLQTKSSSGVQCRRSQLVRYTTHFPSATATIRRGRTSLVPMKIVLPTAITVQRTRGSISETSVSRCMKVHTLMLTADQPTNDYFVSTHISWSNINKQENFLILQQFPYVECCFVPCCFVPIIHLKCWHAVAAEARIGMPALLLYRTLSHSHPSIFNSRVCVNYNTPFTEV
jgi:hypothetical protein